MRLYGHIYVVTSVKISKYCYIANCFQVKLPSLFQLSHSILKVLNNFKVDPPVLDATPHPLSCPTCSTAAEWSKCTKVNGFWRHGLDRSFSVVSINGGTTSHIKPPWVSVIKLSFGGYPQLPNLGKLHMHPCACVICEIRHVKGSCSHIRNEIERT